MEPETLLAAGLDSQTLRCHNAPVSEEIDIRELCDRTRVTPRTVHFYIQQGLLPPSGTTGPGARYTQEHVDRLRLIRLLQNEHLPLAEINRRLRGLSSDQVRALVEERRQVRESAHGSALDYIRSVLKQPPDRMATTRLPAASRSTVPEARAETTLGRSQWERIDLSEGIELNVRRPLTRQQQRKLEKLLAVARDIFAEQDL
jgi:DNA-binding transcriptional MerR regulator